MELIFLGYEGNQLTLWPGHEAFIIIILERYISIRAESMSFKR